MIIKKNIKPKVAVLLAAYNGKEWIGEQIRTIFNQVDVDITVFISVDLSTDDTYEWCIRLSKLDKRVFVLPYGTCFGGAGKNFYRLIREVDFSSYDYVSLADQDDVWLENKLISAISIIREKSVNGYSSNVLAFWLDGREQLIIKSQPQKQFDFLFEAGGPGCTYVLTKNSFEKFKNFLINEPSAENFKLHDWLIYAFYRAHNLGWFIDNIPYMRYRQHEKNQVGFNKGFKAYVSRFEQVKDRLFREEVLKLLTLLGLPIGFRFNRMFLILNFNKLRRRRRDIFILLGFNILGLF